MDYKKIIKYIISFVEKITNTEITIKRRPRIKINTHPNAVNDGTAMSLYIKLVENSCDFTPSNIFEIGANYGQDAEFLRAGFHLDRGAVYIFEPHPQIFSEVQSMYGFNSFDLAVSNKNGDAKFNAINIECNEYNNSGISSLKTGLTTNKNNFIEVNVEMIRMDKFIQKNKIENIDFLKIDVEGMNYEVLEGFGDELTRVKAIQIEGEYKQYWEGQKLYNDIEEYLKKNGFLLMHFILSADGVQSDSFWVKKDCIKCA